MEKEFDSEKAKKNLKKKLQNSQQQLEEERIQVLKRVKSIIKEELSPLSIEVYLVGSIIQPNKFTKKSDIDIVLKGFKGDRFEIWTNLERRIGKTIEVIIYENCHFKEFILNNGLKVL